MERQDQYEQSHDNASIGEQASNALREEFYKTLCYCPNNHSAGSGVAEQSSPLHSQRRDQGQRSNFISDDFQIVGSITENPSQLVSPSELRRAESKRQMSQATGLSRLIMETRPAYNVESAKTTLEDSLQTQPKENESRVEEAPLVLKSMIALATINQTMRQMMLESLRSVYLAGDVGGAGPGTGGAGGGSYGDRNGPIGGSENRNDNGHGGGKASRDGEESKDFVFINGRKVYFTGPYPDGEPIDGSGTVK